MRSVGIPITSFVESVAIGAGIGCIVTRIWQSGTDITADVLMGVAGAVVGRKIAEILTAAEFIPYWYQLATGVGAVFFLIIWRHICRYRS
jgi:uncharacterized membrane protein YeaQ/YmgE (transglycosylase-associated protein family)